MAVYNRIGGGYSKIKVDGMPPKDRMNLTKKKVFTRISALPMHKNIDDVRDPGAIKCRAFMFNDSIYALMQIDRGTSFPDTQQLKFENDRWTNIKEHKLYWNQLECGNVNEEAYAICTAVNRNKNPCVYKFNQSETWEKISEYETPDYALKTTAITGNGIYIIVEKTNGNFELIEFNVNTNTWTVLSNKVPCSSNKYEGKLVKFKNELHFIGSTNSTYAKEHYKFNGETWTQLPTLPEYFMFCNVFATREKIYAIGTRIDGYNWSHKFGRMYEYNGKTWTLISNFPFNKADYETGCLVKDDNIWLLGVGPEGTCARQEIVYTEIKE